MPTLWDLFSLFPACAGVIPSLWSVLSPHITFPRLCGGDPLVGTAVGPVAGFSPPVRG